MWKATVINLNPTFSSIDSYNSIDSLNNFHDSYYSEIVIISFNCNFLRFIAFYIRKRYVLNLHKAVE